MRLSELTFDNTGNPICRISGTSCPTMLIGARGRIPTTKHYNANNNSNTKHLIDGFFKPAPTLKRLVITSIVKHVNKHNCLELVIKSVYGYEVLRYAKNITA